MGRSTPTEHATPRPGVNGLYERRKVRRMSVKPQQVLPVAIRYGQGTVCQGHVLNLSVQGMLVEFPPDQVPSIPMDARVSVKLHYLGDSIWLPGLVRHRKGQKMGFLFPALTDHPRRIAKHPLTVVLHSLSRAAASL